MRQILGTRYYLLVVVGLVHPWLIPEPGMTSELLLVLSTSGT